ncbi:hypothetical protein OCU04_011027 [Sclerotinia nivalis]|uniref:Uncharacterized protein n=1 Tax=Sclerotinia nivalis TaxID=352851 RepID=A0A9X0DGE4_9HELO|nr:hypothetical protein OCU04_011027 [Sclerotinia nivalis]
MATGEQCTAHDELIPSLSKTTPNPSFDRILRWILTGDHTFETDFVHSNTICSTAKTETAGDAIPEKTASDSPLQTERTSTNNSETASTDSHPEKLLTGHDNDPIRPSTDQINRTFLRGERMWRALLTQAASPPAGWIREGWLAPYTLLQNMPPLPRDLPRRRWITGQALWHVPHPELSSESPTLLHNE